MIWFQNIKTFSFVAKILSEYFIIMKTVASQEHLKLSSEIKKLHSTLRYKTKQLGAKRAWQEHLQAKAHLQSYAKAMKELAINHWEVNERKQINENTTKCQQRSRIKWTVDFCHDYFLNTDMIQKIRQRELRILDELKIDCTKINEIIASTKFPIDKMNLLDVGSCYNPFKQFPEFQVTAIDIAPAIDDVFECDFLNVDIDDNMIYSQTNENHPSIIQLQMKQFHVIVFSLLLEYLPTSEQRLKCCEKAYTLLQNEGILCIITPDSKHPGVNAKLMKTWRYALAQLGFGRIKIEKLEHITCMVFRKCIDPEISQRWARMHKESYMDYKLEIPQDFTDVDKLMDVADKNPDDNDKIATKSENITNINAAESNASNKI